MQTPDTKSPPVTEKIQIAYYTRSTPITSIARTPLVIGSRQYTVSTKGHLAPPRLIEVSTCGGYRKIPSRGTSRQTTIVVVVVLVAEIIVWSKIAPSCEHQQTGRWGCCHSCFGGQLRKQQRHRQLRCRKLTVGTQTVAYW